MDRLFRRIKQFGGHAPSGRRRLGDRGRALGPGGQGLRRARLPDAGRASSATAIRCYCDTDVATAGTPARPWPRRSEAAHASRGSRSSRWTSASAARGTPGSHQRAARLLGGAGQAAARSIARLAAARRESARRRNRWYDLLNVMHPFTGIHLTEKGLDALGAVRGRRPRRHRLRGAAGDRPLRAPRRRGLHPPRPRARAATTSRGSRTPAVAVHRSSTSGSPGRPGAHLHGRGHLPEGGLRAALRRAGHLRRPPRRAHGGRHPRDEEDRRPGPGPRRSAMAMHMAESPDRLPGRGPRAPRRRRTSSPSSTTRSTCPGGRTSSRARPGRSSPTASSSCRRPRPRHRRLRRRGARRARSPRTGRACGSPPTSGTASGPTTAPGAERRARRPRPSSASTCSRRPASP